METTEWISPFEYAKRKGISLNSVYRHIREGKIKNIKREQRVVERIMIEF